MAIERFKTLAGRTLFVAVPAMAGCALSLVLLPHIAPRSLPSQPPPAMHKPAIVPKQEKPQPTETMYYLPVRLKVPRLSIDTMIDPVGIGADGNMQPPRTSESTAWYKFGPRPGEKGSAVIAGHYGVGARHAPSVFDTLHTLPIGDSIYIEDEKGTTSTFTVREFRTYDRDKDVVEVFHSIDGKAHLNLVTCQGTWDKLQQTYSHRLVLFADKK